MKIYYVYRTLQFMKSFAFTQPIPYSLSPLGLLPGHEVDEANITILILQMKIWGLQRLSNVPI